MALKLSKDTWRLRESELLGVFGEAAERLSPEGKAKLGSLAWHRHDAEYGPSAGLQDHIRAASFLEGYYTALVRCLDKVDSNILINLRYGELRRERE